MSGARPNRPVTATFLRLDWTEKRMLKQVVACRRTVTPEQIKG